MTISTWRTASPGRTTAPIVEFCSVDPRLLPTGYVPLADFERSAAFAREALEMGCKALLIASACPRHHSPSHVGLDPVWAQAQEAGIPIVFHVGGGGRLVDPMIFENGLPPVPDFHGGDDNFRSVDYIAIQYPVMQVLGTLIIDRVLDRFPTLRFGVIEQGGTWLPGLMRTLDSAADAFRRNEERLQQLELRPSEYVTRQVRVTPYPHEDAGGSSSSRATTSACSRPTTRTSKAAGTRSGASSGAWRPCRSTPGSASTATTSSTSWARGCPPRCRRPSGLAGARRYHARPSRLHRGRRMSVTAYVLIQTEVGKAVAVAEQARKITGVLSADDVTGPYDVIVKTEAPSLDELGKMVVSQIQSVEGITRTFTCPVVNL